MSFQNNNGKITSVQVCGPTALNMYIHPFPKGDGEKAHRDDGYRQSKHIPSSRLQHLVSQQAAVQSSGLSLVYSLWQLHYSKEVLAVRLYSRVFAAMAI